MPAPLSRLDVLESEALHLIREVAAEFDRPTLLFSGGKDSAVLLRLAEKAFWPAPIPFPVLHVDTGHNFDEVIAFRDQVVERYGLTLEVARVQDYIDDGRLSERADGTRNPLQTTPLLDAIAEHRHDAVFGGGRRDEERARQPADAERDVEPERPGRDRLDLHRLLGAELHRRALAEGAVDLRERRLQRLLTVHVGLFLLGCDQLELRRHDVVPSSQGPAADAEATHVS